MPVTHRQRLLAMTAAAALSAVPAAQALAQGSAGTSRMPQTTQTTPQEGAASGTPGARGGANSGSATTQTVPGNNAGAPARGEAPDRQVPQHMQERGGHTSTQGQGGGGGGSGASNPGGSVGNTQAPRDNAPGNPPSPNAPGRRSDAGTPPGGGAAAAAGAPAAGALAAVDSASMRDARRASRVIGAAVYNENNESIGEVDDIVLPGNGGAPVAVVSVGGFLGIGAKLVAVPYERLRVGGERSRWTLTGAASRDDLNRLPTFSYESTAGRG
jgi:sporulation protein YlmC with PRC-barrel domain